MMDTTGTPVDLLWNCVMLEVEDVDIEVRTGVYSVETHLPQPLRVTARAWMRIPSAFRANTQLQASVDYMRIRDAIIALPTDRHFTLVEAVAEELIATMFRIDPRIEMLEVKVGKLALSTLGQKIGIRLRRTRETRPPLTFQ